SLGFIGEIVKSCAVALSLPTICAFVTSVPTFCPFAPLKFACTSTPVISVLPLLCNMACRLRASPTGEGVSCTLDSCTCQGVGCGGIGAAEGGCTFLGVVGIFATMASSRSPAAIKATTGQGNCFFLGTCIRGASCGPLGGGDCGLVAIFTSLLSKLSLQMTISKEALLPHRDTSSKR